MIATRIKDGVYDIYNGITGGGCFPEIRQTIFSLGCQNIILMVVKQMAFVCGVVIGIILGNILEMFWEDM